MSKQYQLRIASAKFGDETPARLYAIICDENTIEREVRAEIVEQYNLSEKETPVPKMKIFQYALVDNKILEAGGDRFYLVKAVDKDHRLLTRKWQIVRAKTALEAMQASSKALWLRKDKIRWAAIRAELIEDLYDIIQIGEISED